MVFRWVEVPKTKVFTKEIASKWVKCMKLSMRWYFTDYPETLHTYCYIHNYCTPVVSVNLIDGLSTNRDKQITVFKIF